MGSGIMADTTMSLLRHCCIIPGHKALDGEASLSCWDLSYTGLLVLLLCIINVSMNTGCYSELDFCREAHDGRSPLQSPRTQDSSSKCTGQQPTIKPGRVKSAPRLASCALGQGTVHGVVVSGKPGPYPRTQSR